MKLEAFVPLATYTETNSDAVAANAVAVARHLDAGLAGLALNASIPSIPNALSRFVLNVPDMIRDTEAASRERGEHLLAVLAERAREAGVTVSSEALAVAPGMLAETAARQARYFDLSLIGWEATNGTARSVAEAVIFASGRPVALLPELSEVAALDHIAIAWDDTRVAARAVADALPFLARAARVSVLSVLDDKPLKFEAAEKLAAHLRRRGLHADAVPLRGEGAPIAGTLQQSALDRRCTLLVMGGYGHSRMRDFVLGGATRGVLEDLLLPVLLSH